VTTCNSVQLNFCIGLAKQSRLSFIDLYQLYKMINFQGAYNSGKHGNISEFVRSGKLGENSGNLKFTPGIYKNLSSCVHNCQ